MSETLTLVDFEKRIRLFEKGLITRNELSTSALESVVAQPRHATELVACLNRCPVPGARECGDYIETWLFHKRLSLDFDRVRRSSPLQPGTRLALSGGYDYHAAGGRPHWLNGRKFRKATFLNFVQIRPGTVPAARVEFDEAVETAANPGRCAILRGSYSTVSEAWTASDIVAIYIFPGWPADGTAGWQSQTWPDAVETHAQYRVIPSEAELAREVAQLLDELNANSTARQSTMATWRLNDLLSLAPELMPLAIPSLIERLRFHHAGPAAADVLHGLGQPALEALADHLSRGDAWLRRRIADAIGRFGPDAIEFQPQLEKLLLDEADARAVTAMALWRITGRTAEMAKILVDSIRGYGLYDDEVVDWLREMGPDAADVIPELLDIFQTAKWPALKAQVVNVLGGMGHEAAPALPLLIAALSDPDEQLGSSAWAALHELHTLARTADVILVDGIDRQGRPSD